MKNNYSRMSAFRALFLLVMLAGASNAFAQPSFSHALVPDTIGLGSTSTLVFVIDNQGSVLPVDQLAFVSDLLAMEISAFPNVNGFKPNSGAFFNIPFCAGDLTAPAGGFTITFQDGELPALARCLISVDVTRSFAGVGTVATGTLTSSAGDTGGPPNVDLDIANDRPGITKSFSQPFALLGERVSMSFTIDNTLNLNDLRNVQFVDELPPGLEIASPSNFSTDCGHPLVEPEITAEPGTNFLAYSTGFGGFGAPVLTAGATCQVSVDLVVRGVGLLGNSTSELAWTRVNNVGGTSGHANAWMEGSTLPVHLVKEFLDDPVAPGDTVALEFTLTNYSRTDAATDIEFTDDLAATLAGLTAVGTPINACGGTLSGTTLLTLSGASLMSEESCSFSVDLVVPANAAGGNYVNITSEVTANTGGGRSTRSLSGARDNLFVSLAPTVTKTWTDDPVGAGGTATLEFTVTNISDIFEATEITFSDEFNSIMQTAVSTPAPGFCGVGSTATFFPLTVGSSATRARVEFQDLSLAAGSSCTFQIVLDVHPMAYKGLIDNTTSPLTATVDGVSYQSAPASDDLAVIAAPLINKEFIDDPIGPGSTGTLEFTVSNDNRGQLDDDEWDDYTNVALTDNLDAALTGMVAVGLPQNDVCGAGSMISGTDTVTLSGGSLPMQTSCTFGVTVQVPADATPDSYTNQTSPITAAASGVDVSGTMATDDFEVEGLIFTKSFTDDPVEPGQQVTLEFTIQNASASLSATGIVFTDDLDSVLDNLVATGLPAMDICGAGSSLTSFDGGRNITFSGGSLGPNESCTFSVILDVPFSANPGSYANLTSMIRGVMDGGTRFFAPASDVLEIGEPGVAMVEVNKAYTVPHPQGLDPEVLITLTCEGGASVAPNGGVDVLTVGGVAMFTVTGVTSKSIPCIATEVVPDGYVQASSDCDPVLAVPNGNPPASCTITNRPAVTTITAGKTFSDGNPTLGVVVTPSCSAGTLISSTVPANATATEATDVVFTLEYFAPGSSCTFTESALTGYTQGVAGDDCAAPQPLADGVAESCEFLNEQDPVTVTVEKVYTDGSMTAVPVTLTCGSATINPPMGMAAPGSPAVFTVSDFAWDGEACVVVETPPPGFELQSTDCDTLMVSPGINPEPSCTLTNRPTIADFTVGKTFSDGNPMLGVEVMASCTNGGMVTAVNPPIAIATEATDVVFTIEYFTPGATCTATEAAIPNYTQGVAADDCTTPQPIADQGGNACKFFNQQDPVTFTVQKAYTDDSDIAVPVTLTCGSATIDPPSGMAAPGVPAMFTVSDFAWDGDACVVVETPPPGYALESNDCDGLVVSPGVNPEPICTLTNRPTIADFTVGKTFSDGNPVLGVEVMASCTNGGMVTAVNPPDAIATEATDVVFTIEYFTDGASCTATEAAIPNYTQGVAADDCTTPQPIADQGGNTCDFFNQQDPATITVDKEYVESNGGPVTVTFNCSSGTLDPPTAQAEPGSPAVFTLNDFAWDGATCDGEESNLNPGFYQVDSTCDGLELLPGGEAACAFTNARNRATYSVRKEFDDDNPMDVEISISCNTGLPIQQSTTITDYSTTGYEVSFIVNSFLDGELDCDITEVVPPGYLANYESNGGLDSDDGVAACEYQGAEGDDDHLCVIENNLQQVPVDVEAIWMDSEPDFNNPTYFEADYVCVGAQFGDIDGELTFNGTPDLESFLVYPHWNGNTTCSVMAQDELGGGVESDDSSCQLMSVTPGVGNACQIINTRFYEGIPVMSNYGLAILAFLMLGMGVFAFRRFT